MDDQSVIDGSSRQQQSVVRAGIGSRVGAALIDNLLLSAVFAVVFLAVRSLTVAGGAFVVITACYTTILEGGPSGQSLGKRVAGIRVIGTDGLPIGYVRGFVRVLLPFGVGWISNILALIDSSRFEHASIRNLVVIAPLVCYLWILSDSQKQGLHDKASSAYVVPVTAPALADL